MRWRRPLLGLAAPAAAVVLSVVVSALVLWGTGNDALHAYDLMWGYGTRFDSMISIVNRAVPYYLAGVAVAVGFKMNLFNIGVDGQYRLAALLAAAAGAAVDLWAPLHVAFIIVVAMAVGAAWAAIPAVLKVTRGVSEVISCIMLNTIATGLAAWLLATHLRVDTEAGDLVTRTPTIPSSGHFPSLNPVLDSFADVPRNADLQGFLVLAVLVGIGYYVLVWRTRFGFDLRATGLNPFAARVSGVGAKAMVVRTMVLSGAVAGLVGLPQLLGFFHDYSLDFPSGLGFTGIAVALLGRNSPIGIAIAALLFGFLERSAQILDLEGIPKEIVIIMQGVIVLSVVVSYEVVRRITAVQHERETQQGAVVPVTEGVTTA